ncbi:MFS transporter [Maribacter sp. 2210JD10-5]|uniref:MFS transporter n=1 Tax=Maribacter sp. 2210JD10-5 TaxID=3386272 RepID=UPI0039BC49C0
MPKLSASDNNLRWATVGLLFIAMVNAYIDRGNISMAAPVLTEELLLSNEKKGWIFSAFTLGYALMMIPAGRLVDLYGVKRIYTIFYLLWGICSATFGLAQVFWHFVALRVVLGFCEAASGPASFAFIADYFTEKERGLASGIFLAGTKIGPAIGAVIAAFLIENFGWRMLFVLSGLVPLIWILPWWSWVSKIEKRPHMKVKDKKDAEIESQNNSVPPKKVGFLDIIKKRKTIGIFLGYFCYGSVWYLYINWLPSYLYDSLGLSIKDTGWWAAYAYGGLAVVTILAGFAADKLIAAGGTETKVRIRFIVAGFLCGAAIMLIPYVEGQTAIFTVLLIAISGMGLATANTWAIMQTIAPKGTVGTLSGIQNFGATSGGFLAPLLAGYAVGDSNNYNTVFIVAGALMLIGILSYVAVIGKVEELEFET